VKRTVYFQCDFKLPHTISVSVNQGRRALRAGQIAYLYLGVENFEYIVVFPTGFESFGLEAAFERFFLF
jgi:hypothetical protein